MRLCSLLAAFLLPAALSTAALWAQSGPAGEPADGSPLPNGANPELVVAPPSPAEVDDLLSFKALIYRQEDDGGNPLVDEDATVVEGILFVRKALTAKDQVHVRLLGDIISAASQRQVERNADMMITGATKIHPFRFDVGGGYTRKFDGWDFGVTGTFAQEYAYRSHGVGAKSTVDLFEGATRLTARGQAFFDSVRVVRFDGSEESRQDRETLTGEFSVLQSLTPRSHVLASYHYTKQRGFLETSFHSVFVNGTQVTQEHPRHRRRQAGTLRYKHAVGDRDAVEVGYRYYRDDWGIQAHTAEARYHWRVPDTPLMVIPQYRFYIQEEADFFAVSFNAALPERTSDSDLGDFTGHLFGLQAVFLDVTLFGYRGDYDLSVQWYHRDDGLDLYWSTFGLAVPF